MTAVVTHCCCYCFCSCYCTLQCTTLYCMCIIQCIPLSMSFRLQRGAHQARQGGASINYAAPNAFGSFASQAGQEAPSSSGLSRMFGGVSFGCELQRVCIQAYSLMSHIKADTRAKSSACTPATACAASHVTDATPQQLNCW